MLNKVRKLGVRRLVFAALLILFAAMGVTAVVHILLVQADYARAQHEYSVLRPHAPGPKPEPVASSESAESQPPLDLSAINADYIGWIRIDGTTIDYPVVRGEDNDKYISTTFGGEQSASGAIFMDYRCTDGFDGPVALIYGHNMKDGSMFAGLSRYLDNGYLDEYPNIAVITPDGDERVYRVFAAIKTDITDAVYALPDDEPQRVTDYMAAWGAPAGAERHLVLATCTSSRNEAERLMVFASQ